MFSRICQKAVIKQLIYYQNASQLKTEKLNTYQGRCLWLFFINIVFLFCTPCHCNRLSKGEVSCGLHYYGYAYNDIWYLIVSFLVCKLKGCMLQNILTSIQKEKRQTIFHRVNDICCKYVEMNFSFMQVLCGLV